MSVYLLEYVVAVIALMMEAARTSETSVYFRNYTALYPTKLSYSYSQP
jgi:hypothetical protein